MNTIHFHECGCDEKNLWTCLPCYIRYSRIYSNFTVQVLDNRPIPPYPSNHYE